MRVKIQFDKSIEINIDLLKVTEEKLDRFVDDGVRESNRIYKFGFIYEIGPSNYEYLYLLTNMCHYNIIKDYQLVSDKGKVYCLILLSGSNKYELDYVIDEIMGTVMLQKTNKIVMKSMKFNMDLTEDRVEFLEFLN